jgi:hypothetical protein
VVVRAGMRLVKKILFVCHFVVEWCLINWCDFVPRFA